MTPISFEIERTINLPPRAISDKIKDLDNWPDFDGYLMLPGIKSAVFEIRRDGMKGSRIQVENTDGSKHLEEIVEWDAERKIRIKLHHFSPPLNRIAAYFIEEWNFRIVSPNETLVSRSFELYPKSTFTKPLLWLISFPFAGAIRRHFEIMARQV